MNYILALLPSPRHKTNPFTKFVSVLGRILGAGSTFEAAFSEPQDLILESMKKFIFEF